MISKNNTRETFYYLGLLLVTISSTMIGRTYLFQVPHLNPTLKYGSILFFLLPFVGKKWRKNDLIKSILMMVAVLVVAVVTDSNELFIYILAIILSRPDDFDRICRFLFWTNLFLLLAVFGLYGVGILHDEIVVHNGLSARSLGFAYYNSPAYIVLFLTMLGYYLYSGKTHSYKRIVFFVISAIANYVMYKLTTVRLTLYIYHIDFTDYCL